MKNNILSLLLLLMLSNLNAARVAPDPNAAGGMQVAAQPNVKTPEPIDAKVAHRRLASSIQGNSFNDLNTLLTTNPTIIKDTKSIRIQVGSIWKELSPLNAALFLAFYAFELEHYRDSDWDQRTQIIQKLLEHSSINDCLSNPAKFYSIPTEVSCPSCYDQDGSCCFGCYKIVNLPAIYSRPINAPAFAIISLQTTLAHALYYAAFIDHVELVKLLLANVVLDVYGPEVLKYAEQGNAIKVALHLQTLKVEGATLAVQKIKARLGLTGAAMMRD